MSLYYTENYTALKHCLVTLSKRWEYSHIARLEVISDPFDPESICKWLSNYPDVTGNSKSLLPLRSSSIPYSLQFYEAFASIIIFSFPNIFDTDDNSLCVNYHNFE